MSTTHISGTAVTAGDEQAELQQLRRVRRRVPKFFGVRQSPDGRRWTAAVRDPSGRERILGTEYETEGLAWSAYKRARYQRREHVESTARVDALLAISERLPVRFEVSQSLYGSSMNPHLGELYVYEIATRKR